MSDHLQPYRGMKDYLPAEQKVRVQLMNLWRQVCHQFGFEEFSSPLIEKSVVFEKKTSHEIFQKQMFSFQDQSGRNLVLRPELTPCLARLVEGYSSQFSKPLRWFALAECFRYERPQKGRQRSFLQFNADIIGDDGKEGNLEILCLASDFLKTVGFSKDDLVLKLNSRPAFGAFLSEKFGINEDEHGKIFRILDKKGKISENSFREGLASFFSSSQLETFLSLSKEEIINFSHYKELKKLTENFLLCQGEICKVILDPFLSRGFDYYTGFVFEFFLENKDFNRSLIGGGRYDRLLFGEQKFFPSIGFAISDTVLLDNLPSPRLGKRNQLIQFVYTDPMKIETFQISQNLRHSGFEVRLFQSENLKKALRLALKEEISFLLFWKEEELIFKNLQNQFQKTIAKDRLIEHLQSVICES